MLPPHLLIMFHFHCLCYLLICWWCFTFTFYVTSWSVDYVLLSLSTLPPDLLIMFNFHFLCHLLIRWWCLTFTFYVTSSSVDEPPLSPTSGFTVGNPRLQNLFSKCKSNVFWKNQCIMQFIWSYILIWASKQKKA